MAFDRRAFIGLSAGLLASLAAPERALAQMAGVRLIEPQGRPSLIWTVFDLLAPGLQQLLNCPVFVHTVPGNDGFAAMYAMLQTDDRDIGLLGAEVMATQFTEKTDIRIEEMTPIAKLMNGFSVTLFTRRGSPLTNWEALRARKTLKVRTSLRTTGSYIAALMLQRKGKLAIEVVPSATVDDVFTDVGSGEATVGILPTVMVARNQDQLQAILSFGAARSAMLTDIPTFAEVMGNPKLAFTESLGVFASPRLPPDLAPRLTNAFVLAGGDQDVLDQAEAADIPLAVNRAPILVETMQRNERVLKRILG